MTIVYPAIFYQEENSVWAEFPDLEGCQTFADTLEECIVMAQEALEGYVESVLGRDIKLAPASDIRTITAEDNGFVMPIYCTLKNYAKETKAVKKTLTIPQWLNDKAIKSNINFSETLQTALIDKLYR